MDKCNLKKGDGVVLIKGDRRGRTGRVLNVGGRLGSGEIGVEVILFGKRTNVVTFYPASFFVKADVDGSEVR